MRTEQRFQGQVGGAAGCRERTLRSGWAELWETGQGTGLPFAKMAGAVMPEGAEQLVAVVTEGAHRMLMRLAGSWAVEGSARGATPSPQRRYRLGGDEGGSVGHRLSGLDFQGWEPVSKAVFASKSWGSWVWALDSGALEERAGNSWVLGERVGGRHLEQRITLSSSA